MTIDLRTEDLDLLYAKANEECRKCICNKDNDFLKEEIAVPLKTIKLKQLNVKIVFSQEITENYLLEINLILCDKYNKSIGRYVYVEDNRGNAVEDSLVFF